MSFDTDITKWREHKSKCNKAKRNVNVVGGLTILGILLFFYKISQTSEMALQYSSDVQESVGNWVIVLFIMFVTSLFLQRRAGKCARQLKEMETTFVSDLRQRLASAQDGERATIESQLREMGM